MITRQVYILLHSIMSQGVNTFLEVWMTCEISLQVKLISGNTFVHETLGHYKTIEELWDGEI